MGLGELGREAVAALRAHNLRSFLTLLGIIIGVGTLVGVVSVITGLNAYVRERVIQLSPDVYVLQKFGIIQGRDEFMDALKRRDIDWNDYQKLRSTLERAETVAADATSTSVVKRRHRRLADVNVHGTTANYGALMRLDIEAGRFFTPGEEEAGRAVAVIGWDIRDELFGSLDPIGREVLIGAQSYRVIGLVAQQGRTLGQSQDNQVWIPAQTYRRTFGSRRSIDVVIKARGGVAGLEASVDEVRAVLRALRHTSFNAPDPFGIVTVDRLQALWSQISGATIILSLLIASVSLGVGGIVIMNIMLVAVVERTREIGVRLSLGARKRDIRRQFLLEAALLALWGGVAGVILGAGAALGVEGFLNFPARVTPGIVLAGLALSIGVGLGAGYWPARNASNLPVVDALRSE
jgi:putative ABC transport system permease protein